MSTPAPDAPVRISSAEAIPLAYALTARVAADAGIRALAIKGVVLAHHTLRAPRISADVDLLISPDAVERFAAEMISLGWRRPPEADGPRLRRQHAINLVNDHWPIGIDVHIYFPGFLAPDAEVFDVLWDERVEIVQGSQPVQATGLSGSAAIAALHYLRQRSQPSNVAAFETLLTMARTRMAAEDLIALSQLATATGSVRSLQPFLSALGVPNATEHPAEADEWPTWLAASTAERSDLWHAGWTATPWRDRPRFLWRSFQPDEERLRHLFMRDMTSPLWRLRLRRARHVASKVPDLVRGLRNS